VRTNLKILGAALLALALPSLAQAGPKVVDRVAAVVNEEMIPYSEVEQRAATELAALEAEGHTTPEKTRDALRHALDEIIADRLLVAEEKNASIEVTDQEVDYAIDDVRKQNSMDAATFERALMSKGQTMTGFRDKMRRDLSAMKLIGQKVRAKVKVTDEDVKAEYTRQSHADEADVEVHARHIVVQVPKDASKDVEQATFKRAEALAKRARAGEDFAELAKKNSEGPSKAEGGDVGFFKRGEMVGAFDKVAFSLKPGEISDPVRSPFGWHVILVVERRAGAPKPFEQVKDDVRDKLWREAMQRQTEQYVAELRKQATVDIKVPELKE
jgi:peptidyl-prolyl cis-trans isomerase SurA